MQGRINRAFACVYLDAVWFSSISRICTQHGQLPHAFWAGCVASFFLFFSLSRRENTRAFYVVTPPLTPYLHKLCLPFKPFCSGSSSKQSPPFGIPVPAGGGALVGSLASTIRTIEKRACLHKTLHFWCFWNIQLARRALLRSTESCGFMFSERGILLE